jgi:predicted ferric reductase
MGTVKGRPSELSAFLCGPESMVNTLQKGLVKEGVKVANVHREYYNLR